MNDKGAGTLALISIWSN